MKNRQLFIIMLLFGMSCTLLCAQNKQGNIWYFGYGAGLNFNSGTAVALTNSAMFQEEGCSSIADSLGNLLFYSDGITVWNKQHQPMPNGTGLHGHSSSTQSALIIQQPGSSNLYYIFTTDYQGHPFGFSYSKADMNAAGGMGDIILKNVQLITPIAEKVTACFDSAGTGVWVITHAWSNINFLAYHLTSTGLDTIPVTSSVGPTINASCLGYLKSNSTGNRLAMANTYSIMDKIYLFDFDNNSGIVSNEIDLNVTGTPTHGPYGVSFSLNGEVLYGAMIDTPAVYQWDLSSGNAAAINSSRISLPATLLGAGAAGALGLGPDGKIYYSRLSLSCLGVINNPDTVGLGCNYIDNGISLLGKACWLGLPNYNEGIFKKMVPVVNLMSTDTNFCEKHCINFTDLSTNNPTSWQWLFPGSDSLTSTEQNPTNICYNQYGSFDVTLIACNAVGCDTLVLPGFINEYQAPTPTITQSNDTLFSSPGVAYQWWSVDSGLIAGANNFYYIPTQGGSYFVIVTDTIGCDGPSNTIIITGIAPLSLGEGQGVRCVPNPNNGTFTITLTSSITKDFSLRIINPIGQTISYRQQATGYKQNVIDVNIDGAAKGLYLVEVINGGKVYRGKVLKE